MPIQIILALSMLLALGVTWRRVRQHVITVPEAVAWSCVWIGATVVILLPNVTTRIAELVGIGRGADLVLYGAIAILFLLVFKLFIKHEKLERAFTKVVRQDALSDLEKESQDT